MSALKLFFGVYSSRVKVVLQPASPITQITWSSPSPLLSPLGQQFLPILGILKELYPHMQI